MSVIKEDIIFIMGVSGVGKSTIGNILSKSLNIPFFDGDDYHPASVVAATSQTFLCCAHKKAWKNKSAASAG